MLRNAAIGLTSLAVVISSARAEAVRVTGRVVDADGVPVESARVAPMWFADVDQPMKPFAGVETDAEGRFSLDCDPNQGDQTIMAIAKDGATGGAAVAKAKVPSEPLAIRLGPLAEVRGRFTCDESGKPPVGTNLWMIMKGGRNRLILHRSRGSEFALRLPPGEYDFVGHGSRIDYEAVHRPVTLRGGLQDLGAVDLKLTTLARHYGKELPPWHVADARGLPQGKAVTLADFKGKWVVLDFWGYWCNPCVSFSLPSWMQFVEERAADRDKFVVLAFHDPQVESFADLDAKLAPVVKSSWGGKLLPFPILLDSTGATIERFGVQSFPTVLLIDPEGRLVRTEGVDVETYLAGKLPTVPIDRRIAYSLERVIPLSTEGMTLDKLVEVFGSMTRLRIDLDEAELKAAGVPKDVEIPRYSESLTLRDWLDLALNPFKLTFVPGSDGLKIVRKTGS